MPHDKNGQLVQVGNPVVLTGRIKSIDSAATTYCNVTMLCDKGMEPAQDQPHGEYSLCISARMVELADVIRLPGEPDSSFGVRKAKGWRKRMDAILQEMKYIHADAKFALTGEYYRHLGESITNLENAIMRQGMTMKEIEKESPGAAPNPYPTSYDPNSPKVEPTADGLRM